jgi:chorismate mutase
VDLNEVRKKIDSIDFEIMKLLSERMELALRTKRLKDTISDPQREQIVIENVRRYSQGLIRMEFVEKLFKDIRCGNKPHTDRIASHPK